MSSTTKRIYYSFKKKLKIKGVYTQSELSNDPLFPNAIKKTRDIWCFKTKAKEGDIASGLASSTDIVILFPPFEFDLEIKQGDTITIGTSIYPVKFNQPIESVGGEVVLNKVFCEVR
jgi:hypothetical protein